MDNNYTTHINNRKRRLRSDVRFLLLALTITAAYAQAADTTPPSPASALFQRNCAVCHGPEGKGIAAQGTPNFTNPAIHTKLTEPQITETIRSGKDGRMPAWSGKLTSDQITALARYVQSLPASDTAPPATTPAKNSVYEAGDDVLFSLPTGRKLARHGVYVNFSHRFPYDPAVSGAGRGAVLFGLDGLALPSFGVRYGLTDKLSLSVWRSPSLIGRPIQLMAAFQVTDEHDGHPVNFSLRLSGEGQDNFRRNFTHNIEAILSRSITHRAQVYLVPTLSLFDRPLIQGGFRSGDIPHLPGTSAFSLGIGAAFDVRPTVALVGEVIPTLWNGQPLGIHRPAYSFGIQKKILRQAFTLGLSNSPGTTVSQRAGTRASFLGVPDADTPKGLFLGFNLTRQVR